MSTDEQQFNRLASEIGQHVTSVQASTRQIRGLAQQIGTERDSEALRAQIHSLSHTTMAQCQRATLQLKQELTPMCQGLAASMRRVQKDRLVDQVTKVAGDFQEAQRLVQAREKEAVARQRRTGGAAGLGGGFEPAFDQKPQFGDDDESPFRLGGQQQQQQQQQRLDLESAEQRENQLHQLEQDIVGVNELFKDLAHMVHDQGEMIDSIEDHVSEAVMHVETGNKQLGSAVTYQRAARRKKVIIAIIIIIVVIVIGVIIYLSVPKNN